jgi:hypothetical protein
VPGEEMLGIGAKNLERRMPTRAKISIQQLQVEKLTLVKLQR